MAKHHQLRGVGVCGRRGDYTTTSRQRKMAGKLMESLQTDLSTRIYRITNGFNEALYLVANEPSLGMYRLQEHIQSTVPRVVEQRQVLQQVPTTYLHSYVLTST